MKQFDHIIFSIFIFMVLITAAINFFEDFITVKPSFLGVVWGVFGFYRFLYLMNVGKHNFQKLTWSLPQILSASLSIEDDKKKKYILHNISRLDVIAWFILCLMFAVWMISQTYFPSDIELIEKFRAQQLSIIGAVNMNHYYLYESVVAIAHYGVLGLILFSGLSFGYSRRCLKWGIIILLPCLFIISFFIYQKTNLASPVLWPVSGELFGRGLGAADIMMLLMPELMNKSGTPLLARFIEGGSIAAYGASLILLPITMAFFVGIKRLKLSSVFGLTLIAAIFYLDSYYVVSVIQSTTLILIFALLGLCWGATRTSFVNNNT